MMLYRLSYSATASVESLIKLIESSSTSPKKHKLRNQTKNLVLDGNRSRRASPLDARGPPAVVRDVTDQPSRPATHLDDAQHQERLVAERPQAGKSGQADGFICHFKHFGGSIAQR